MVIRAMTRHLVAALLLCVLAAAALATDADPDKMRTLAIAHILRRAGRANTMSDQPSGNESVRAAAGEESSP